MEVVRVIITLNIKKIFIKIYPRQIEISSFLIIQNLLISGNQAIGESSDYLHGYGGGILIRDINYTFNSDSILIINNSEIHSNYATKNGGGITISNEYSFANLIMEKIIINNSKIYNNNSITNAGGIYIAEVNMEIINSSINNNSAIKDGGGLFINNSNLYLNYTTISNNYSTNYSGGGMYVTSQSILDTVKIINSIFSFNTANTGSGIWSTTSENIININYSNFHNIENSDLYHQCTNCSDLYRCVKCSSARMGTYCLNSKNFIRCNVMKDSDKNVNCQGLLSSSECLNSHCLIESRNCVECEYC